MPTKNVLHWIMTIDSRHANLLSGYTTPNGSWHFDPQRTFNSAWDDFHEHHRPSTLAQSGADGSTKRSASFGHEDEELQKRFARDACKWINDVVSEFGIEALNVFAPARILTLVREPLEALAARTDFHDYDLAKLRPNQLAEHPAILRALKLRLASPKNEP